MGVDHIVEDGPGDITGIETGGGRHGRRVGQEIDAQSGEAHDGAPREGQSQDDLRVVRDPFGERVGGHQREGGDAVVQALQGELQQDAQAGEKLHAGEEERSFGRNGTPGQGPMPCPRHLRVEPPVPEIVDGAACAAHDQCAGEEEQAGAHHAGWRGDGVGQWRGQEGRPETWEVEIVCACRLVETDQFGVGNP